MRNTLNIIGISAIIATLLVGIGYASSIVQPKMVGSQWAVYEEPTLPNGNLNYYPGAHAMTNANGGVQFAMPMASSTNPVFVNYMLDTYTASLNESSVITASIAVDAPSGTTFMGNPLWTSDYGSPVVPTTVRLFIQSNLPNTNSATCTGGGNAYNYWWAHGTGAYTFTSGSQSQVLSASLNPADWSDICGTTANSSPAAQAAFDDAIAHVKYVGLSFGSGYFFASGIGVNAIPAGGSANFVLNGYQVN